MSAFKKLGIFISYRRYDARTAAGWLAEELISVFGANRVFRDINALQPGERFPFTIHEVLASCGVLLAVIGPSWFSAVDDEGKRRLENPKDWVRQEIALALRRKIAVIPILVEGAHLPTAEELPDDLRALCEMQAVELRDDQHRDAYVRDIVEQIRIRAGIRPLRVIDRVIHEVRSSLPTAFVVGAIALCGGWYLGRSTAPQEYVKYTVSGGLDLVAQPGLDPYTLEFYVKPPDFYVRPGGRFSGTVVLPRTGDPFPPTLIIVPRSKSFEQAAIDLVGKSDVNRDEVKRVGDQIAITKDIILAHRKSDEPAQQPQNPIPAQHVSDK